MTNPTSEAARRAAERAHKMALNAWNARDESETLRWNIAHDTLELLADELEKAKE